MKLFEKSLNGSNQTTFDYQNRPYLLCLALLSPIAYFTNIIILYVVVVILKKDCFKFKSYLFLANICTANLIAITSNILVTFLCGKPGIPYLIITLIEKGAVLTPQLVSMWCICLVTLERLIYITCPVKYDMIVTSHRIIAMIAFVWTISGTIGFLPTKLIFKQAVENNSSSSIPAMLIIQFTLATFIIIVMFTAIITLYRFSVNVVKNSKGLTMKTVIIRTLIFLLFALLLFILSWEPYLITSTVYYFHCSSSKNTSDYPCEELWTSIIYPLPWIATLNSLINPNAYIWWYKPFWESFKTVFFPNAVRERKRMEAISCPLSDV